MEKKKLHKITTADIEAEAIRKYFVADGVFVFVINSTIRGTFTGMAKNGCLPDMPKILPSLLRGLANHIQARDFGAAWHVDKAESAITECLKRTEDNG